MSKASDDLREIGDGYLSVRLYTEEEAAVRRAALEAGYRSVPLFLREVVLGSLDFGEYLRANPPPGVRFHRIPDGARVVWVHGRGSLERTFRGTVRRMESQVAHYGRGKHRVSPERFVVHYYYMLDCDDGVERRPRAEWVERDNQDLLVVVGQEDEFGSL